MRIILTDFSSSKEENMAQHTRNKVKAITYEAGVTICAVFVILKLSYIYYAAQSLNSLWNKLRKT